MFIDLIEFANIGLANIKHKIDRYVNNVFMPQNYT